MAVSAGDEVQDLLIGHQAYLQFYINSLNKDLRKYLREFEKDLRGDLTFYEDVKNNLRSKRELLSSIKDSVNTFESEVRVNLVGELKDFSKKETEFYTNTIKQSIDDTDLEVTERDGEEVYSEIEREKIALSRGETYTIIGFLLKYIDSVKKKVQQSVEYNLEVQESERDLRNSLFGASGALHIAGYQLGAVTATMVNHFSAKTRERIFLANADKIKGYQWISVMDSRTSTYCRWADSKTWFYETESGTLGSPVTPPAHENCYDKDTEVYTDSGWKLFKDLEKGVDKCYSIDPDTKEARFIEPDKYISYHYTGEMIHFTSRDFDMLVTPDHNMLTRYRKSVDKSWKLIPAKDIPKWDYVFYRGLEWDAVDPDFVMLGDYKVTPRQYAIFMGYFLSEGSCTKISDNSYRIKIAQTTYLEKFYEDLKDLPFNVFKTKEAINIFDFSVCLDMYKYGKTVEKYIPDTIRKFSKETISVFMNAFILGDGRTSTQKGVTFKGGRFLPTRSMTTTSKQMADVLGELLLKIGKRPSYSLKKVAGTEHTFSNGTYILNHDLWIIRECHTLQATTEHVVRKRISYDDMVYCVELPEQHTLLVRRNGRVAWSGNCRSSTTPIFKSWEELGLDNSYADRFPGTLPKQTSYYEWLQRQPTSIQREVLGTTRYTLWKNENVSPTAFYNRKGKYLTLRQLQEKNIEIPKEYLKYIR